MIDFRNYTILLLVLLLFACTDNPSHVQSWGGLGAAQGQFNEPFDVAVDKQGFVYVTDVRNKRVQKFTADGDFILAFGQALFEKPSGIAIAPDETVWVTDYDLDKVFHFDSQGQLMLVWGKAGDALGEFASPVDVAVNAKGLVYVVDQYHHRIQIFSSDAYNNRVQAFDSKGGFIRSIGGMGLWGGRFRVSSGIAIGADNHLFVADFYNNRIQEFDNHGHFMNAWGGKGKMLGQFNGPTGIAIHTTGQIYITDWGNHRIQKLL